MDLDRVVTPDEKILLEKIVKHRNLVKRQFQNLVAYGLRSAVRKCQILPYFAFVTDSTHPMFSPSDGPGNRQT